MENGARVERIIPGVESPSASTRSSPGSRVGSTDDDEPEGEEQ